MRKSFNRIAKNGKGKQSETTDNTQMNDSNQNAKCYENISNVNVA